MLVSLATAAPLDRESASRYRVGVSLRDRGGRGPDTDFTVEVADANDAPTVSVIFLLNYLFSFAF